MMNRMNYLSLAVLLAWPIASAANVARADLITGLVGHWGFDETSGTTANASVGPNGALNNFDFATAGSGGNLFVTHRVGTGAIEFGGADDYISYGGSLQMPQTMTVASWVNIQSFTGNNRFYLLGRMGASGNRGTMAQISNTGQITLAQYFSNSGQIANSSAGLISSDSQWHHVAISRSAGQVKFYLDGVFVEQVNITDNTYDLSSNPMATGIGFSTTPGTGVFSNNDGLMDDLRLYNRALSDGNVALGELAGGDIAELFALGNPVPPAVPIPEPASGAAVGLGGLILLGGIRRRQRPQSSATRTA